MIWACQAWERGGGVRASEQQAGPGARGEEPEAAARWHTPCNTGARAGSARCPKQRRPSQRAGSATLCPTWTPAASTPCRSCATTSSTRSERTESATLQGQQRTRMQACLPACSLLPAGRGQQECQRLLCTASCISMNASLGTKSCGLQAPHLGCTCAAGQPPHPPAPPPPGPHLCGCSVPSSSQCAVSPPCDTTRCATSFTRARFQPASSERDHCRSSFHAAPLAVPRVPPSASSRKICRRWGGVCMCVWGG